jgi:hypothetical protein
VIRSLLKTMRVFLADPIFRGLLLAALIALVTGTAVYHYLEDWSLLDAFYFSTITLATVGYGDFVPTTDLGRLFTILYVMFGAGIFATFVTAVALVRLQQVEATRPMAEKKEQSLSNEVRGIGTDPRLNTTAPTKRRRRYRPRSRSAAP